jgi:hypothetical protein
MLREKCEPIIIAGNLKVFKFPRFETKKNSPIWFFFPMKKKFPRFDPIQKKISPIPEKF